MTAATTAGISIADRLRANARRSPDRDAIVYASGPGYQTISFGELDRRSDAYAAGFARIGIGPGTKTILMLRPGPELFAVIFGLVRAGAVPVVVDPGMGVRRMLHCYRSVGAEAFVGLPVAHLIRLLNPRTFTGLRARVTAGRRWCWGGHTLAALAGTETAPPRLDPAPDDLQLISFTTGSTGPAKGVEYTAGMVAEMVRQIEQTHGLHGGDVSLLTLPTFGLVDLATGATTVQPALDPTRVAAADPRVVVDAVHRFGVTTMFASPALLDTLGRHLTETGTQLPTLRCLVSGGAPVSADTVATVHAAVDGTVAAAGDRPEPRFWTSYGATEALPISTISAAEIQAGTAALTRDGAGTCVGRPVPGIELRIVRVIDGPLPAWSPELAVPDGEVGEIAVAGPMVSPRYHGTAGAAANALGKIMDGARVWHRTGDLGWVDGDGRLWFCGRKAHRVPTVDGPLYTVQCEGVFNAHPDVYRTALVGVPTADGPAGVREPVLCVQLRPGVPAAAQGRITDELRQLAAGRPGTKRIHEVLYHPRFPVDVRHNAKIGREELSAWAAARLGRTRVSRRVLAARLVPLAGWLFLLYGTVRPFGHPVLQALFWLDAFLSVVVHGLQLPLALRRARPAGRSRTAVVLLTFLFGATWWREQR